MDAHRGTRLPDGSAFGLVAVEARGAFTGASGGHVLFDDGVLRITRAGGQPWLLITGEIDEFSYAGLRGALSGVNNGPGDIHIDLTGVEYCDLAGLREFVLLAEVGRQDRGRSVVLHEIPAHLKTVLQILGWDSTPGLVLASVSCPQVQ